MPELPEVETIVRALRHPAEWLFKEDPSLADQPGILGRVVKCAEVTWQRTVAIPSAAEFTALLPGLQVLGVDRRGKFICIDLGTYKMLIHLRMSGDLRVEPAGSRNQIHDRVRMEFQGGSRLVFNDTRKFGRVWLVKDENEVLSSLGPDPFSDTLSGKKFYTMLHEHSRAIKPLLLDQSFLAGLGNIYSDEALFRAGIHPRTRSDSLTMEQTEILLRAIRTILEEGIERNGASIDWVYRGGSFQNHFHVYQRTGKPCLVCGTPIQRITLGQRGTHYCPSCQPGKKFEK